MRKDKLKVHKERKHFNPQPRKKRQPKYESGQVHYCDKCDYSNLKMRNLQVNKGFIFFYNSDANACISAWFYITGMSFQVNLYEQ